MSKGILYDATLCVGCLECEKGCARENELPYDDKIEKQKKTNEFKFTYVAVNSVKSEDKYMRRLCMHCEDPACASVCPVGALEKTKLGPVVYDAGKCMGCRYCMIGCPFGIPKYEWSKQIPTVKKCIMCAERVAAGKPTACTESCPTGATIFGERADLLAEARKRLAANPGNYVNHIYGETEVGGTSVLMLSAVPFEQFDLKPFAAQPLPELTGAALHKIPSIVTAGATALGGIYWITNRREAVASAERGERNQKNEEK